MTIEQFSAQTALAHFEIEQDVEKNLPTIQKRVFELYKDPSRRLDVVYDYFINAGVRADIESGQSEDYANNTWAEIDQLVELPLDELQSIPRQQRSDNENTAMTIIMAASNLQAELETGLLARATAKGLELGEDNAQLMKGVKRSEIGNVSANVKGEFDKLRKSNET